VPWFRAEQARLKDSRHDDYADAVLPLFQGMDMGRGRLFHGYLSFPVDALPERMIAFPVTCPTVWLRRLPPPAAWSLTPCHAVVDFDLPRLTTKKRTVRHCPHFVAVCNVKRFTERIGGFDKPVDGMTHLESVIDRTGSLAMFGGLVGFYAPIDHG
jgi:hypothetical protein